jgi:methionine synthase I (cobalamin-dependent)
VAGSVGPLGISGEEAAACGIDREQCFGEQVGALLEGGVDLIVFETFMDFEEMEIAYGARKKIAAGLTICSLACAPEGRISSEMSLGDAFTKLHARGAQIGGVNCMNAPDATVKLLQRVPGEDPLSAYPSAGDPNHYEGRLIYPVTPEDFAQAAHEMVAQGVRLIGGCCGTTPAHIDALAAEIAKLQPVGNRSGRAS